MHAVVLFSGCGGADLGLQQAGYTTSGYEIDPWLCSKATQAGCPATEMDLTNQTPTETCDHLHISAPCQGFSRSATPSPKHDAIRQLTVRSAEILVDLNPATFSFENVIESQKSWAFDRFISIVTRSGYDVLGFKADASRVGCAQIRHRLFLIGLRHSETSHNALQALIPGIKQTMQTAARTRIQDICPEVNRPIFLYPRGLSDKSLFPPEGCLPTMRRMALALPSPSLHVQPVYKVGVVPADDEETQAIVLDEELAARLSGFPSGHFEFKRRERCRWSTALGNIVPPPMQRYVMTLVEQVRAHAGDEPNAAGSYHYAKFSLSRSKERPLGD